MAVIIITMLCKHHHYFQNFLSPQTEIPLSDKSPLISPTDPDNILLLSIILNFCLNCSESLNQRIPNHIESFNFIVCKEKHILLK